MKWMVHKKSSVVENLIQESTEIAGTYIIYTPLLSNLALKILGVMVPLTPTRSTIPAYYTRNTYGPNMYIVRNKVKEYKTKVLKYLRSFEVHSNTVKIHHYTGSFTQIA